MDQIPTSLTDNGTRYQHLAEYRDSLEVCMKILQDRGLRTLEDRQRFAKFTTALEVITTTLDSYAGLRNTGSDFYLYRLVESVPKDPTQIEGGRGTPLV